ncbi:putative Inositol/phosphatidylinositol phosphatase [Balamuthia mandrillaris]
MTSSTGTNKDETNALLLQLEDQLRGVERFLRLYTRVLSPLRKANESLQHHLDKTRMLSSAFDKSSLKLRYQEPILAEWLGEFANVNTFMGELNSKMNSVLSDLRFSLSLSEESMNDMKRMYTTEVVPLKKKLTNAQQNIQKIRALKGGVNMDKLLEAERARDAVLTEIEVAGGKVTQDLDSTMAKARCSTLCGMRDTMKALKSFFQKGHEKFEEIEEKLQNMTSSVDKEIEASRQKTTRSSTSIESFKTTPNENPSSTSQSPKLPPLKQTSSSPFFSAPPTKLSKSADTGDSYVPAAPSAASWARAKKSASDIIIGGENSSRRRASYAPNQTNNDTITDNNNTNNVTKTISPHRRGGSSPRVRDSELSSPRSFSPSAHFPPPSSFSPSSPTSSPSTSSLSEVADNDGEESDETDSDTDEYWERKIMDKVGEHSRSWISRESYPSGTVRFEARKLTKRGHVPKVVEFDLHNKFIHFHKPNKQEKISRSASDLLQVTRSHVSDHKVKLRWRGREKLERFLFLSKEHRERFYEVSWHVRKNEDEVVDKGEITLFVGTWNLGNAPPPQSLSAWIKPDAYDLYVIAAQECEYNLNHSAHSNCEADWFHTLQQHLGEDYVTVASQSLMAMRLTVLVRRVHYYKISCIKTGTEATGIGNVIGNKGAVGIAFQFNESKLCFVGSHLAARDERVLTRNANYTAIIKGLHLARNAFDITNGFNAIFWIGDLNYRLQGLKREEVLALIEAKDYKTLMKYDQLAKERGQGRCFAGFYEPPINFPPTYRYNRGNRTYSEEKMRMPSYCDRILYKKQPYFEVECHEYNCCDSIMSSDHSPLYGTYTISTRFPNPYDKEMTLLSSPRSNSFTTASATTAERAQGHSFSPSSSLTTLPSPRSLSSTVSTSSSFASLPSSQSLSSSPSSSTASPLLGCQVKLVDVKLHLNSVEEQPGSVVKTNARFPNPYLTFHADFIDGHWPTPIIHNTNTATWNEHIIDSFTVNKEWLEKQYIGVIVYDRGSGDSAKRIGQGVIPLLGSSETSCCFTVSLTEGGLAVGTLSGYVELLVREMDKVKQSIALKEGFLMKEGKKLRSWKRRWFVLKKDCTLEYFANHLDTKPLATLPLTAGSIVKEAPGYCGKKYCLSLYVGSKKRTYFMYADDEWSMKSWISSISGSLLRGPTVHTLFHDSSSPSSSSCSSLPGSSPT